MKTHRPLRYVISRASGAAGAARRATPAGTARAQATRGILVPALVLASLGAVVAAWPDHHIGSHVQAGTRQAAPSHALVVRDDSVRSCMIDKSRSTPSASPNTAWMYAASPNTAWMYAASPNTAWMYAVPRRTAWMYVAPRRTAWMYVAPRRTAWMYVTPRRTAWMYVAPAGQVARLRACLRTSRLS